MTTDLAPTVREIRGIHEVVGEIRSPYLNHDLEPTSLAARKWATKDIAALWISMSACVPTYMLASSLISEGMIWWQAELSITLGNVVVQAPMVLNAHAGTKYGIPFPVYCRPAFGVLGANVPAILRALVACGWFGIQTWIGGWAIYKILAIYTPGWEEMPKAFFGINLPQLVCFLFFWSSNMGVSYRGIESIRLLLNIKAPLLIFLGLLLLYWAHQNAGGFGPMLDKPSAFAAGQPKEGQFFKYFVPGLTGMIGFWATLSLNIPDFTRYAYSQRDQVVGQALGLPTTMGLFSFIGVAVTSATVIIYGEVIWDPVVLITRFKSPVVLVVALLSLILATLATNIAANVVSPANDFANLWPKGISFRAGGTITGVIGILIQPWRLVSDPKGYIFTWLVGYSALLGAIGGVLICDYYVVRRTRLDLVGLYQKDGPYWYVKGWNPKALVALAAGILPNLPGFLGTIGVAAVPKVWLDLYSYAWFVGFGISFGVYAALTLAGGRPEARHAGEVFLRRRSRRWRRRRRQGARCRGERRATLAGAGRAGGVGALLEVGAGALEEALGGARVEARDAVEPGEADALAVGGEGGRADALPARGVGGEGLAGLGVPEAGAAAFARAEDARAVAGERDGGDAVGVAGDGGHELAFAVPRPRDPVGGAGGEVQAVRRVGDGGDAVTVTAERRGAPCRPRPLHTLAVPSAPPVTSRDPSGENARARIAPLWPESAPTALPSGTFQEASPRRRRPR